MKREPGFYWIIFEGRYTIAELDIQQTEEYWFVCGHNFTMDTEDFEIVSEKIIPPNEK